MCMIPHQGIALPIFFLPLIRISVELRVGDENEAYLFRTYWKAKNRTQWRKQIIQSDQDVHVCGIFVNGTRTPFAQLYLLFVS